MRNKPNIRTWFLLGLLLLSWGTITPAQARPWDYQINQINSRGDTLPRYNRTCHRLDNGGWCWGHGRNRCRICRCD